MKIFFKLLFKKYIDRYSKVAVQYIEDNFLELKGSDKKKKAVEFITERLGIPSFFRKIPFLYNFLYRHLKKIQAFIADILIEEIDFCVERCVREIKNESV